MSPVLEYAAATTLILGCVTAVGVLLSRLWRGTRNVVRAVEIIQRELQPNGSGSTYDRAKIAAEAAVRAEAKAEGVATDLGTFREGVASDLATFRAHQSADSTRTADSIARLQDDLTTLREGQDDARYELSKAADSRAEIIASVDRMHGQITAEAAERMADALDLLAEHGGPDLRPHMENPVPPHAHALPVPPVTGGPVPPRKD